MLSLAGAHVGGVGKNRQEHCDEQHREPSQWAEVHVHAGRCGPSGYRSAGRWGRVAFGGMGRVAALWRSERPGPSSAVGDPAVCFDGEGHRSGGRQTARWLRRYRGTASTAVAVAAATMAIQLTAANRLRPLM